MGRLKKPDIAAGWTVSLDTVALVYFLERHPVHHAAAARLLRRIEMGEISGVISSLVFVELLVPAYRTGDRGQAETILRLLSSFPNLKTIDLTPAISADAARLRARCGLRTPDAIHAGSALAAKADVLVTNDLDFRKLGDELPVWFFEG